MTKKIELTGEAEVTRARTPRKKVYERRREGKIPDALIAHFKKDNYDLKLVRRKLQGDDDFRYLSRREEEGYEFVTLSEIPEGLRTGMQAAKTEHRDGLLAIGDLILMKIDTDLRNSRRKYFQAETDREVNSVDVHVLEKRGFRNLGTKSKVILKEPSFEN